MNGYKLTKVFRIDNNLVIGDSIEDAVQTYKSYMNDDFIEIKSVELISGDMLGMNTNAIIKDVSTNS
jgi:hypothetical protein